MGSAESQIGESPSEITWQLLGSLQICTPGPLSPGSQWDSPPNTQTYWRVPKSVLAELPTYETRKDKGVRAACHYQTQYAMTAIKSLWALYSDGQ